MSALSLLATVAPDVGCSANAPLAVQMAEQRIGQHFGGKREQAVAYLAAHILTVGEIGGAAAGPVTSEREGDLARSYGVSAGGGGLETTAYGREFQAIRQECILGARNRMT